MLDNQPSETATQLLVDSPDTREKGEASPPKTHGETQASSEHPKRNEDAIATGERFVVVLDGLGSKTGSELTARFAAKFCAEKLQNIHEELDPDTARSMLEDLLRNASREAIHDAEINGRDPAGAAITIACKFIDPDSGLPYAALAHAGDVRAHSIDAHGTITQTTLDHSSLQRTFPGDEEAQRSWQQKLSEVNNKNSMDGDVFELFSKRYLVTSFIGMGDPESRPISTDTFPLTDGQYVLVTSDGIHDSLTPGEIEACCRAADGDITKIPGLLIAAAEKRSCEDLFGSKIDDMTAGVLKA